MTQPDDTSGSNEFRLPADAPAQDVFDQTLSEILGKDNPHATAILSAVQRTLNQYHLAAQFEVHEILHEAYLRGKKKIQAGDLIHNPYAWLKATAFHVIYERKRKHRASATEPSVLEAMIADDRLSLMQQQVVQEEIDLLYQALHLLRAEDPYGTSLLCQRTVAGWSWGEISRWLVAEGHPVLNEAALRQRASRAKRRLREIFWQRVDTGQPPATKTPAPQPCKPTGRP